jgi:hypothetical protein
MRRLAYALLTAILVTLIVLFGVRAWSGRLRALPRVEPPPRIAGRSCAEGLQTARGFARGGGLDQARPAYLWLAAHCEDSAVLPDVTLEAGSLLGHLMHRPREARQMYELFLQNFPTHPGAADATYHLAKLELDAGNYAGAVAHLTALTDQFPDSGHAESARFLTARAVELLAAHQRAERSLAGQLAALVPNNVFSFLVLLIAVGPAVISSVRQARGESGAFPARWSVPAIVIGLTVLNFVINKVDNGRRDALVMDKLDRLLAVQSQVPGHE